jgi:Holin of 3TMs, for gene-transfer release
LGFAAILGLIAPIFSDLIKRIFPDPEKQAEANARLQELLLNAQIEANKADAIENEAKKEIITTEMNQNSWFSDWRAKLMTMCTLMIGFNWIICPVLNSILYFIGTQINPINIPSEAWVLLNVGLGGYIGEKTMATYQQGKVDKAKAENPINEDILAAELRRTLFKQGMTQEQWEAIRNAADKANG